MAKKAINVNGAVPVGPYSPAVESGNILYFSGQTPMNPLTKKIVEGNIDVQIQQCFENLFNILKSCGLTSADVVKVTVFLTDMNDFNLMNTIYSKQFTTPYPARTTIGVASLPLGAKIEIDMIAHRK